MKWSYDPTKSKYTKELMEPIVQDSKSYYDVIRKLGLKITGSANSRIRVIVSTLGLDTSHFLGRGSNRGPDKKGGNQKLPWQSILVYDRLNGRKEQPSRLRRALIESGIEERCETCSLGPEWNGQPLVLQIDHKNGDSVDNRTGNPRFLCPNCHAQTPTFGSNNMTKTTGPPTWRKKKKRKRRVWEDGRRVTVN